ncbi:hypothetical protein DFH06DRAFT_1481557 [Mycena polygramma]|nr:hypothetical protein DFH06DRAFT_1481557 [Mycena polygramma]
MRLLTRLTRNLTRLRHANTSLADVGAGPDDILPSEIWERISNLLDDHTLLTTAAVCTNFNELCSIVKFPLNRLPFSPISHLSCTFGPTDNILHGLGLLLDIVRRSKELTELDLEFPNKAFGPQGIDRIDQKLWNLHNTFYDVLHAMSAKAGGQVLCYDSFVFSVCAAPTLSWHYLEPRYLPVNSRSMSKLGVSRDQLEPRYWSLSKPRPKAREESGRMTRLQQQFNTLLEHVAIRDLAELKLRRTIPSATLDQLLHRHQALKRIIVQPRACVDYSQLTATLTAVTFVQSGDAAALGPLIDYLHGSPLKTAVFPFPDGDPQTERSLLEKISNRASITALEIGPIQRMSIVGSKVQIWDTDPVQFSDTDLKIARSLENIVRIRIQRLEPQMVSMLPWFRALRSVELYKSSGILREVQEALPGISITNVNRP